MSHFIDKSNERMNRYASIKVVKTRTGIQVPLDAIETTLRGYPVIDIVAFDNRLSEYDAEYDSIKCTYQNKKNVSMLQYLNAKFDGEFAERILKLM